MIEVVLNDRLGKKIRVKCNPDDTIGDLKKLVAEVTGEFNWLLQNDSAYIFFMWYKMGQNKNSEMVQCLQRSYYFGRLRNQGWNGSGTLL
ncbi:Uncharacterized protein CTYZ_00003672 [Cryptosporidium tyzzeri]|nr:Uncharacterized protein CTYZ_00003672 [Cryptosporidium tyzzeri]